MFNSWESTRKWHWYRTNKFRSELGNNERESASIWDDCIYWIGGIGEGVGGERELEVTDWRNDQSWPALNKLPTAKDKDNEKKMLRCLGKAAGWRNGAREMTPWPRKWRLCRGPTFTWWFRHREEEGDKNERGGDKGRVLPGLWRWAPVGAPGVPGSRSAPVAPGRPPSLPVGPCRSPWVPLAPSGSDQWRNFLQCCTTLGITSRFTSRFFGVSLCSCQTAVSNCRSASESVAFDLLNFLPLYLSICFFLSFSPLFSCCWLWLRLLLGRA